MAVPRVPLAIVGAGAAGLMAAITAGREGTPAVVLDGAKVLGAKILVSGGGRCNVTHDVVTEHDYAGSSAPAVRRVLRRFKVARTIEFFADLGVTLKREETGKLFPTTDSSRTVLEALLRGVRAAGAEVRHPWRIEAVALLDDGAFRLSGPAGQIEASRVVLAMGGRSLPRSGSDGAGLEIARGLGHHVTPRVVPALVGLTVAPECFVRELSGIAVEARLEVRGGTGRRLARMEGSLLCTHFGLSGPVAMDISRHWQLAVAEDPAAALVVSWLPEHTGESLDAVLRDLGAASVQAFLARSLPSRLARALCDVAGVAPSAIGHTLRREARRALVRTLLELSVPVTGTRGWNHAEATAGGIPLAEVHLDTLESRVAPGLYLCGEILDVDGRIGGFNFQWAWASGYVAGLAAARRDRPPEAPR